MGGQQTRHTGWWFCYFEAVTSVLIFVNGLTWACFKDRVGQQWENFIFSFSTCWNFFPSCCLENFSWMVRVLLFVIYTKQIKYTINTDTLTFNWVLRNASFKKLGLCSVCTNLFQRPHLESLWVSGFGFFSAMNPWTFFFFSLVPSFFSDHAFRTGKHWISEWLKFWEEKRIVLLNFSSEISD